MSKTDGWISIHRKMQGNWVYEEKPYSMFQAWIDILFEVNHENKKVVIKNTVMECGRGESLKSLDTWAERWGWSKSKVRRFLQLLESDTMVILKSERITTRLSVVNYDTYQGVRNANETQVKRKPTPNNNINKKNTVDFDFEKFWLSGSWGKQGKKQAERHFKSSVKTQDDFSAIQKARENYSAHLKANTWKHPMNGSTWFNNWRDFVEWKENKTSVEEKPFSQLTGDEITNAHVLGYK